ncbi:hypothetical protein AB0C50_14240 [Micromonospora taraxaci]|uniref:hypothetical protein n=1 Tax=Micromonospora taraxaci TaxID=1316803 RepID=UPI0033E49904
MPPRQRPRNWLAGRLRSAAGAVERLAGRVEPVGQPRQEPPSDPPRRFGEPPQHWLDVVATHAPGLLHDLDLDTARADAGRLRDDRPDGTGTDGAVPGSPDGPTQPSVVDRGGRSVGERSRPSAGSAGFPAAGTRDTASADSPQTGGRRRPSGARGGFGAPDVPATADGTGTRVGPDPGAVGSPETVGTPATAGLLGAAGAHGTAGSLHPTGGFPAVAGARGTAGLPAPDGSHGTAGSPSTPVGHGTTGTGRVGSPDASGIHGTSAPPYGGDMSHTSASGRSAASWPAGKTAGSIGELGGSAIGNPAGDTPGGGETPDGHAGQPRRTRPGRLGSPHGRDAATSSPTPAPVAPGGIVAPSGRSRRQGFALAAAPGDAGWDGRAAVEVGGSWPALPDERARPDHRRPDQHAARQGGWRGSDRGTVGAPVGAAPRDPVGGRWPVSIEFPPTEIGSAAADPWPALPDDGAVWAVPGDVLDTAHLGRLDREQAGD